MKLYFTTPTSCFIADFTDPSHEPANIASFALTQGQSTFTPRYSLVNNAVVDNYPGKKDEEVAAAIKTANDAAAAALVAAATPAPATK
jgi:hypothetical protein